MSLGQTFKNLSRCLHGSIDTCLLTSHEVFVLPGYRILQNLRMITCKHTLRSGFWLGIPFRAESTFTSSQFISFLRAVFSKLTTDPNHFYTLRATMNPCSLTNKTFIFFAASFSFASSCLQKETASSTAKTLDFETLGLQHHFAATNSLRW